MELNHHRTGNEMLEIAYQIARVLVVIHHLGVVHGDLSPNNILVTWRADGTLDLVLTDWDFPTGDYVPRNGMVTREYRSPECYASMTLIESPIDIWAFGVILAQLFSGLLLFPQDGETQAQKIAQWIDPNDPEKFVGKLSRWIRRERPDIHQQTIDHIARIIADCLKVDRGQRSVASEIMVRLANCPTAPLPIPALPALPVPTSPDSQPVSKKARVAQSLFGSIDQD